LAIVSATRFRPSAVAATARVSASSLRCSAQSSSEILRSAGVSGFTAIGGLATAWTFATVCCLIAV
jgi:hypothetical protein